MWGACVCVCERVWVMYFRVHVGFFSPSIFCLIFSLFPPSNACLRLFFRITKDTLSTLCRRVSLNQGPPRASDAGTFRSSFVAARRPCSADAFGSVGGVL